MKALTVYQPWASLECLGLKGTETRGRGTSYRGPLVIHAGKRWDDELSVIHRELHDWLTHRGSHGLPDPLPLGRCLAVAELVDCLQVTQANQGMFGEFERVAGDLTVGRYVWVLDRVRPLRTPIPWRGAQGLWTAPPELVAAIDAQTRRKASSGPVAQSAGPTTSAGTSMPARNRASRERPATNGAVDPKDFTDAQGDKLLNGIKAALAPLARGRKGVAP